MIEQSLADTPTPAQQAAYDKSIAYVAPTVEEKAALKANNTLAAQKLLKQDKFRITYRKKQLQH